MITAWLRALVGCFPFLLATACAAPEEPAAPAHGILLVGLDTLRADGLGAYGNPRPVSPVFDGLAERGVLFENAVSNASWTLPGFIAILSGDHPSARVFQGRLRVAGATRLRDAGYRTAAFTEGGYVSRQFGFDLGFETFWEETAPVIAAPSPDTGVAKTFGKARAWLREHGREPFFLFVHSYEPHVPYQRLTFTEGLASGGLGGPYDRIQNNRVLTGEIPSTEVERAWVRALYDGGVAEADRELGGLLAVLDELGVTDRTVVVVTSDHGEQLGEHDVQALGLHGQTLWDTVLHVPLLVVDPRRGDAGRRVTTQVRTVDVMPTLLELAGLPPEAGLDGRSLLPVMAGRETADRPAYSELRHRENGALRAATLRTGRHKLHLNPGEPARETLELYDLARDPAEQEDLALAQPEERNRLNRELQRWVSRIEGRGQPWRRPMDIGADLQDRLKALGYGD
jgi:arylsulfatase A-like enzyme